MDVRGTKMDVGKDTLMKNEGSNLANIFLGQNQLEKTSKGRIFIDRNPVMFQYVLDYVQSD